MDERFSSYDTGYDVAVPDNVQKFAKRFAKVIREQNVYEILRMYQTEFEKISQRYYVASPWPKGDVLMRSIDIDDNFLIMYRELYFRHQFTHLELPSSRDSLERLGNFMEESLDCWENYINLFNVLIQQNRLELDLPNKWLWDIIDMFVLQFQEWNSLKIKYQDAVHEHEQHARIFREIVHDNTFDSRVEWSQVRQSLDRARVYLDLSIHTLEDRWNNGDRKPKDYSWTEERHVWSPIVILRYFHALANKGRVNVKFNISVPYDELKENQLSNIARMTGYFAIIGLLRIHTLCGDYSAALRVLDAVDLSERSVVMDIPSCRISTYYFLAFCFLMTRRYSDCAKTLEKVLVDNVRPAQRHPDDPRSETELVLERMRPLLAISYCLSPQPIDDTLLSHTRDLFKDDWHGLMNCDDKAHENLFARGCPDFISLSQSSNSKPSNELHPLSPGEEQYRQQLRIFLREVSSRKRIPRFHKFMKLYTAISMEKFSTFLKQTIPAGRKLSAEDSVEAELDEEAAMLASLVSTKLKTRELKWRQGRGHPSDGVFQNCGDLDFYVDESSIHIRQSKPPRQCSGVFLREIEKTDDYAQRIAKLEFVN